MTLNIIHIGKSRNLCFVAELAELAELAASANHEDYNASDCVNLQHPHYM